MSESAARIERLLADELDGCCDDDVDARLDELDALAADASADDTRDVFAVLGNETRYRLARALAVDGGERCVCELEALVDVSDSAVSHALSDLVSAGLLDRRKDGNWRYYRTTPLADALMNAVDSQSTDGSTPDTGGDATDTEVTTSE